MKKLVICFVLLVAVTAVHAGPEFTFARVDGTSDPLDPGDWITIDWSTDFAGYPFGYAYFQLYYQGVLVCPEQLVTNHTFQNAGSELVGNAEFDPGAYVWADEVGLLVKTIYFPKDGDEMDSLASWYSYNTWVVNPSGAYVPSMSLWGLLFLLIAVPLLLVKYR